MQSNDENLEKKKITILHDKNKSIDFQNEKNLIKTMSFHYIMFNVVRNRMKNV